MRAGVRLSRAVRARVDSKNITYSRLRCLRKIIVPIICWVASETLNRQCSTSESLSNLEASFGLISRFESIAHRYNYFFFYLCVCGNSSIILLFLFLLSFLIITYSVRLSLTLRVIFLKGIRSTYSGTVSLEYHAVVSFTLSLFTSTVLSPFFRELCDHFEITSSTLVSFRFSLSIH